MRKKIQLNTSMQELASLMSEGNPGALSVLMPLMTDDPLILLDLDDMNIRGPQVWVGYKDFCGEDLEKFKQCVRDRSEQMVSAINDECIYENDFGSFTERAVTHGASWERRP